MAEIKRNRKIERVTLPFVYPSMRTYNNNEALRRRMEKTAEELTVLVEERKSKGYLKKGTFMSQALGLW